MNDDPSEKSEPKKADRPPSGEVALVQGKGYRCMAYRDKDGKWRDYVRRDELPEPITIVRTIQPG